MAYSTNTTILGVSRGDPDVIYQWAKAKGCKRPADVKLYLETLSKLCRSAGMRFEVAVAQSIHETSDGSTPWVSYWWQQRLNPAGIGITGDDQQDNASRTFADGAAAARAHFAHLWLYAAGTSLPTGVSKADDPRWDAAVQAGYAGIADTIADLTNRWGIDNAYAQGVVKWLNVLDGAGLLAVSAPDPLPEIPSTGDTTMATYSTTIPGLTGGPLVTDYPINIKLIPASRTYQRPGIKAAKPRRSVQHGTGNPNSMAASEISWLVDSQAGGGQVSFHSTADDLGVWVGVPADEVTWQAADGGGPGNMNGFSCEMIENSAMWASASRRARAIYITADFMGKVSARLGIAIPEQHWTFNYALPASQRHDCPDKLRHVSGAWNAYVTQWNASKAAELKRMAGDGTGGPTEPTPIPVIYAKPIPIPELAGVTTDMHDVATGVVSRDGGDDFIFVADVVEATEATPRLQYADIKNSPKVEADIEKGERFIVTWLVKADDGEWYYVSPYWTRIYRKHTKRIADAPVLAAAAGQNDDLPEAA